MINPTAVARSGRSDAPALGDFGVAAKIEHAVLVTLEEGKVRTGDVVGYNRGVSTSAFADTMVASLGGVGAPSRPRVRGNQAPGHRSGA